MSRISLDVDCTQVCLSDCIHKRSIDDSSVDFTVTTKRICTSIAAEPAEDIASFNEFQRESITSETANNVLVNVEQFPLEFDRKNPVISIENTFQSNSVDENCKTTTLYISSPEYIKVADQFTKTTGRLSLVDGLINSYGLIDSLSRVSPEPCSKSDLCFYHSSDYVDYLELIDSEDFVEDDQLSDFYGLNYDCPILPGVYQYSRFVVGATLTAARALGRRVADVAINWGGGWHHAFRDRASGFCYVNDCVIAILELRKVFSRVLYVDIDVHHGDGVEDAFWFSDKVMTLSFHKLSPGFFPSTGCLDEVGAGKGWCHTVNIPLKDGIRDRPYCELFSDIVTEARARFKPDCVVFQAGADCLAEDPMMSFNLTSRGMGRCLAKVLSWKLPTLLLGGGGYDRGGTARCWAYLTAVAVGRELSNEIPEEDENFDAFGPDFCLHSDSGLKPDENKEEFISDIVERVRRNLSNLS